MNLIPAFREVRSALLSGYVWVLAAWIAIGELVVPTDEEDSGDPLRDLLVATFDALGGGVALIAAVSILAYLTGTFFADILQKVYTIVLRMPVVPATAYMTPSDSSGMSQELEDKVALREELNRKSSEALLRAELVLPVLTLCIAVVARYQNMTVGSILGLLAFALSIHVAVLLRLSKDEHEELVQWVDRVAYQNQLEKFLEEEASRQERQAEEERRERRKRAAEPRYRLRAVEHDPNSVEVVIANTGLDTAHNLSGTLRNRDGRMDRFEVNIESLPPTELVPVGTFTKALVPERLDFRLHWMDEDGLHQRDQSMASNMMNFDASVP